MQVYLKERLTSGKSILYPLHQITHETFDHSKMHNLYEEDPWHRMCGETSNSSLYTGLGCPDLHLLNHKSYQGTYWSATRDPANPPKLTSQRPRLQGDYTLKVDPEKLTWLTWGRSKPTYLEGSRVQSNQNFSQKELHAAQSASYVWEGRPMVSVQSVATFITN